MADWTREQTLLLAAASAAAWCDGALDDAEAARVHFLASLLGISARGEVDALLQDQARAEAQLEGEVEPDLAERAFSGACTIAAADRDLSSAESAFLQKLGARLGLPEDTIAGHILLAKRRAR